jgi:PAS domain S-box-containing protein
MRGAPQTLEDVGQVVDMLFATSSLGISFHDRDLRVVYVNRTLAALGGLEPRAYLDRRLSESLPAVAARVESYVSHVLTTGSALIGMTFANRGRRWMTSYYPVRRPDGEVLGVGVVAFDDTTRHEAERRLHESEERYRALVELSPDGIGIMEDERLTYVNPAGAAIFGASDASEVIGRSVWDFMGRGLAADRRGSLAEIIAANAGRAYDAPMRRLDGTEVTLSVRSVQVDRTGARMIQSVFRDVSQQRLEQRERADLFATLAMERSLFSTVLRELPVGVVVIGADGEVVLRNEAAERIWAGSWDPGSVPVDEWARVRAEAGTLRTGELRLLQALRDGVATPDMEADFLCGDGQTRNLRGTVAPIPLTDGTTRGAVATFWDVTPLVRAQTELRRAHDELETRVAERTASLAEVNERLQHEAAEREAAERQLRMAERLTSIGTLAAGVAHEINNPLAAILATAELARAVIADGERHGEVDAALGRIVDEAHRAGEIVRSLLRFGRGEHAERWPIDVSDVVRRLAASPRVRSVLASCRLRTRLARTVPRVLMNPTELEQVVFNLVQNAVQAGASEVGIQTAAAEGAVRVIVRDDGHGIEAADLERIFDPFFTTHALDGGTGLGLSIVHGIVTRYNGRIAVQSRAGRGTSFTVELPSPMRPVRAA